MRAVTLGLLSAFMALGSVAIGAAQQPGAEGGAVKNAKILDITGRILEIKGISLDVNGALKDLDATVTDRQIAIALSADVLFDFDQAVLKPAAEESLTKLLTIVNEDAAGAIAVVGHTDTRGEVEYNRTLSLRRASAVKTWLVSHQVAAGRISAAGAGESQPLKTEDTEAAHRGNRRVEITINK